MSERFFVGTPICGDRATLEGGEAHHLAHVMRAKRGDVVELFDGSGDEFQARVDNVGKASVELAIVSRQTVNRELKLSLTLAVALPKGDRQQWLVEKAVELGVTSLVPLVAERSVAQPTTSAVARLQRAVIEASKQCGRNRLMEIGEPQQWIEFAKRSNPVAIRLMAHPGGVGLESACRDSDLVSAKQNVVAAIGPEGGFTDAEVAVADEAGWTRR